MLPMMAATRPTPVKKPRAEDLEEENAGEHKWRYLLEKQTYIPQNSHFWMQTV